MENIVAGRRRRVSSKARSLCQTLARPATTKTHHTHTYHGGHESEREALDHSANKYATKWHNNRNRLRFGKIKTVFVHLAGWLVGMMKENP